MTIEVKQILKIKAVETAEDEMPDRLKSSDISSELSFFPTAETVETSVFALLVPVRARTKKRPTTMERFLLPNPMLKPKIGAPAFGVALAILIVLNSPIWWDAPQPADSTAPTAQFSSLTFNTSVSGQPGAPHGPRAAKISALFSTIGASAICDNHGVSSQIFPHRLISNSPLTLSGHPLAPTVPFAPGASTIVKVSLDRIST